jgi:hypothetical protein
MNFDIWYLFEHFRTLPFTGKVAVISGYILVLLVSILWARFLARKQNTRASSTETELAKRPTENAHDCANNSQESGNLEKPKEDGIIRLGFVGKLPNNRGNWYLHYQTENKRQDNEQRSLKPVTRCPAHIHTILDKLRRRVNQSGKEPRGWRT